LKSDIAASPVPLVLDHFGGAQAADGIDQPGFADLLALLRSGIAWVKISGAYRSSTQAPDYAGCAPLPRALIAANEDRIVWGSDWPHPDSRAANLHEITPFQPIDDGRLLNQLALWAPDAAQRQKILVDNPARLDEF